jgi:hypothetical protein
MPTRVTVELLDGKYHSVDLDECVPLSVTDNEGALFSLHSLGVQLQAHRGSPSNKAQLEAYLEAFAENSPISTLLMPRLWRNIVPHAIYRGPKALRFAQVTTCDGDGHEVFRRLGPSGLLFWERTTSLLDRGAQPFYLEIPPKALLEFLDQGGFSDRIKVDWAPPPSGNKTPKAPSSLSPSSRAIAAAYDLKKAGKRVSLKAACALANVDRGHLRKKYPEAVKAIRVIATPERTPNRGFRNRRTDDFDAYDDE